MLQKLINILKLFRYRVSIGPNWHINGPNMICCQNKSKIIIGDNFTLTTDPYINPVGGSKRSIICAKNGGIIKIGNNVGMSHVELVALKNITIQDNVLLGGGCILIDSDHHPLKYKDRIDNNRENVKSQEIMISEGVFIGAHSIILKGVTIGSHSIIAAGSVVSKDIPPNQIWGGNPAHFIRNVE